MARICIFGDSIAYGEWDPDKGGWANRLKNNLESESTNEIEVYNLSICGDTTKGLLMRLPTETMARHPDIIIFAIGINDSQRAPGGGNLVPIQNFQSNLAEIVEIARQHTYKIIFIGLTNVDENKTMPFYSNSDIGRYDQALQELCDVKKLSYISTAGILGVADFEDGLHPNTQGHKKMFNLIQENLKTLWFSLYTAQTPIAVEKN